MNGQWIRRLSVDELYQRLEAFWPRIGERGNDDGYRKSVLTFVQDRLKLLTDITTAADYFFVEPTPNFSLITDNKQLGKLSEDEIKSLIQMSYEAFNTLSEWTSESIQDCLNQLLVTTGQKPGILFSLIRVVTTWAPFSPALNDTLALIGKEKTIQRIEQFLL
jgi:nondiscriminating glutamyl-tRNA synthetase